MIGFIEHARELEGLAARSLACLFLEWRNQEWRTKHLK